MIDHQQILYRAKGSRKFLKIEPIYELPNYDYIELRSEAFWTKIKQELGIKESTENDY